MTATALRAVLLTPPAALPRAAKCLEGSDTVGSGGLPFFSLLEAEPGPVSEAARSDRNEKDCLPESAHDMRAGIRSDIQDESGAWGGMVVEMARPSPGSRQDRSEA